MVKMLVVGVNLRMAMFVRIIEQLEIIVHKTFMGIGLRCKVVSEW